MRRKRPAPAPAEPPAAPVPAPAPEFGLLDGVRVSLYGLLLFLAMTVQTGRMAVVLSFFVLVLSIGRAPVRRLRERFCIPTAAFVLFAVVYGLSAIYARFGNYAVSELYKFMASFSVASLVLTRFDRKHVRALLWMVCAVCAAISLLCVDAASYTVLFDGFNRFVEAMGGTFAGLKQDVWGTRVAGIYNDANVSASILALGSLAGLHLVLTEDRRWIRLAASILMGMNAMGFFLALSRGGILCFAVALIVYLIAVGKPFRLRLFFLMFFTAAVTVGLSIPAVGGIGAGNALPDLLTVLCGVPIFGLYEAASFRLVRFLESRRKAAAITLGSLAALVVIYAVAAMAITGPTVIGPSGDFDRAVEMKQGTYTISGDWDTGLRAVVQYQNRRDVLVEEYTLLYDGDASKAEFTVPEDGRVSFRFSGPPGTGLREISLSNGNELVLRRPLLPDFVTHRLENGLLNTISFLYRIQYYRDGWKLFTGSPLLGYGLGSTEGLLTSVQPFFYESLFVHNHVLQIMDDCGLLGLVFFLGFLGGVLWLLLRRLRKETDPLAAVLLSCWAMMNLHSLMEINFSIRAYQALAFILLLLTIVQYGEPLSQKAVKWGGILVAAVLWVFLGVFGGLLELHRAVGREAEVFSPSTPAEFMDGMKRFVRMDVLDREQYQLNFVANAVILDDNRYNREMRLYTEDLRASGTYTACTGLAEYYYLPRGELEELFACSREAIAQEASTNDAWNQQLEFYRVTVLSAVGADGVDAVVTGTLALRDYLSTYSEGRVEEIQLTEENQAFLFWAEQVRAQDLTGEAALVLLAISIQNLSDA